MISLHGVLQVATRNANRGNDLATAAGRIIARRVALGMAAALDPMQADHAEFERMIPEKMEAFSAAGRIMLQKSNQAGEQIIHLASDAFTTATQATVAMTQCTCPATMAWTQSAFAMAWFEKAASNLMAMGMLALGAQEAAMVPFQQIIAANTERLVGN